MNEIATYIDSRIFPLDFEDRLNFDQNNIFSRYATGSHSRPPWPCQHTFWDIVPNIWVNFGFRVNLGLVMEFLLIIIEFWVSLGLIVVTLSNVCWTIFWHNFEQVFVQILDQILVRFRSRCSQDFEPGFDYFLTSFWIIFEWLLDHILSCLSETVCPDRYPLE